MAQRIKYLWTTRFVPTLLLCTLYVVLIPSVRAILCHHCVGDPLKNLTCEDTSNIIDCKTDSEFGQYHSHCFTLKMHIAFGKQKFTVREKNCTMADEESCFVVEKKTCGIYHNEITQHGGSLISCNVQCCSGNYCNGRPVLTNVANALALSESNRVSYESAMWITTLVATVYGHYPLLFQAVDFAWKL